METVDFRQIALESTSKVRLITGDPGVGKTFFGCKIAEWELYGRKNKLESAQKILFLTFSRNAVARIRQAYIQQVSQQDKVSESQKTKFISYFHTRMDVNTFAGFFWWLVESYGRYIPGNSSPNRLWLIGNKKTGSEMIPDGYNGYTFNELVGSTNKVLKVNAILELVSNIYPLIIIDEFQDVDDSLFETVKLLSSKSRVVLLCGPGQCIYRGLKEFDPNDIMKKCERELQPERFKIAAIDQQSQRYCPEIIGLIDRYNTGNVVFQDEWPVKFRAISRLTKEGNPRELETQVGKQVQDIKKYLKRISLKNSFSLAVLTSTNQGVAEIFHRFKKGSDIYRLQPMSASLHFDDALLLQYGRMILHLLQIHWISVGKHSIDVMDIAALITSLFQQAGRTADANPINWAPLAIELRNKISGQKAPRDQSLTSIREKIEKDLEEVNKLLRANKKRLPTGSPSTPFTMLDSLLLQVLKNETLNLITTAFNSNGSLQHTKAKYLFESSMHQKIIFEKLGIETGVQVMTIHKSKGREFDGVVLVLENNRKALWRKESNISDSELDDLYRVGISRARYAFGLTAYNDIFDEAKPAVQKLLPDGYFSG